MMVVGWRCAAGTEGKLVEDMRAGRCEDKWGMFAALTARCTKAVAAVTGAGGGAAAVPQAAAPLGLFNMGIPVVQEGHMVDPLTGINR